MAGRRLAAGGVVLSPSGVKALRRLYYLQEVVVGVRVGRCDSQIERAAGALRVAAAFLNGTAGVGSKEWKKGLVGAVDGLVGAYALLSKCAQSLRGGGSAAQQRVVTDVQRAVKVAKGALDALYSMEEARSAVKRAARAANVVNVGVPGGARALPGEDEDDVDCPYTKAGTGRGLVDCALGFAEGTIGGISGADYVVKDASDNPKNPKKGTLRWGVRNAPVWITFARDMEIKLKAPLELRSQTTIDGRGVDAKIRGGTMRIANAEDVILHNLKLRGVPDHQGAIDISGSSSNVWVDHCEIRSNSKGLLLVQRGATNVTFSNNYVQGDDSVMLLGASPPRSGRSLLLRRLNYRLRVTVFRNHFFDSFQQMPQCRQGECHVANNVHQNWTAVAVDARGSANVRSEANAYIAGSNKQITSSKMLKNSSATVGSINDLLLNGAKFFQRKSTAVFDPPYLLQILPASNTKHAVPSNAGPRKR